MLPPAGQLGAERERRCHAGIESAGMRAGKSCNPMYGGVNREEHGERMMSAPSKMGRIAYLSSVIAGALLVSMVYPAAVLRMEGMSESAGGAAIIWVLSLPATVVISAAVARFTYKKYISAESLAYISGTFLLCVVVAPLVGILSTYAIIDLIVLMKKAAG